MRTPLIPMLLLFSISTPAQAERSERHRCIAALSSPYQTGVNIIIRPGQYVGTTPRHFSFTDVSEKLAKKAVHADCVEKNVAPYQQLGVSDSNLRSKVYYYCTSALKKATYSCVKLN